MCKSISFRIDGNLRAARFCHCKNCRKFSGAAAAAWATARQTEFQITSDKAEVTRFDSGNGLRCSCKTCGSSVWFESKDHSDIIVIPLGALDTDDIDAPAMHIFTADKAHWDTISDDLPQYDGTPDQ